MSSGVRGKSDPSHTERVHILHVIPASPSSESRVEFEQPEFESARQNRRILFVEKLSGNRLVRWKSVHSLPKLMLSSEWNL